MNLIDEYVDTVSPSLDAPEVFIKASAYHLVSNLLGRFCASASAPGLSGLRPNAWIIISSIQARGRRSTVANYHNHVYELASRKFYEETMTIGHDEALTRSKECYIESGTKEGIVDHISLTDLRTYYVNSTEFGPVLQGMANTEYETGVAGVLSKLYYGEEGIYHLSQRNVENKADAVRYLKGGKYVTMFCGMQEPHLYITPGIFRQGLIRRIVLIYADRSDFGKWIPPLSDSRSGLRNKLNRIGVQFYNKMIEYNSYSKGRTDANRLLNKTFDFGMHPNVIDYINDYSKKLDNELLKTMSNVDVYRQTLWEHLSKYSMIHAIARNNVKVIDLGTETEAIGTIDPLDVKQAYSFLMDATKHSAEVISSIGRIDSPIRTSEDPLDRVLSIIQDEKTISRSDLHRKTKMLSRALDDIIKTLHEQEMIEIEVRPTGGRNKAYYTICT